MDDLLSQLKPLLMKLGLAAVIVGILLILLRYARQWYDQKHTGATPPQPAAPPADDPPYPLLLSHSLCHPLGGEIIA